MSFMRQLPEMISSQTLEGVARDADHLFAFYPFTYLVPLYPNQEMFGTISPCSVYPGSNLSCWSLAISDPGDIYELPLCSRSDPPWLLHNTIEGKKFYKLTLTRHKPFQVNSSLRSLWEGQGLAKLSSKQSVTTWRNLKYKTNYKIYIKS